MKAYITETVFEQTGGIALMGRGRSPGTDGPYFQQADFDSITLRIYDMADPGTPVNGADGEVLSVSDVVFNSLQTGDARWTKDSTGYNFLYETSAEDLPQGGRKYRFEFEMLPTGSTEPFWAVFEVATIGLFSV